jgi:hypothetical protein
MSATYPSEASRPGHREFLSEQGQIRLFILAMAAFSVSVALALAFANNRVRQSSDVYQRWHGTPIERVYETAPPRRLPNGYAVTISPSRPTTSA